MSVDEWLVRPECLLLPSGELVEGYDLRVRGPLIQGVVKRGDDGTNGAAVIDAVGMTLLPGLIDSHVHLTFSADADLVSHVMEDDFETHVARALSNAQQALVRGVTTVYDCGGRTDVMLAVREILSREDSLGPAVAISGAPVTTSNGHCHWLGGAADSEAEVVDQVHSLAESGVDFIKVMLTGGNVTVGSDPRVLQYSPAILEMLAAVCKGLNLPLVIHAHTEEAVALAGQVGAEVVVHATCQDSSGQIGLSEGTVRALHDSGTAVDATITVGMHVDFPGATPRSVQRHAQRQAMLPIFSQLSAAGLPLLAGTDAGVPGVRHGDVAESVIALFEEAGLSLSESLRAATSHPAAVLNREREIGSLVAGARADLLLLDGDVRDDITVMRSPHTVWRGGRIVSLRGTALEGAPATR